MDKESLKKSTVFFVENSKENYISKENTISKEKYKPRYGCGKYQVDVACENNIPNNNR